MVRVPVEPVSILENRATFICAEKISGVYIGNRIVGRGWLPRQGRQAAAPDQGELRAVGDAFCLCSGSCAHN